MYNPCFRYFTGFNPLSSMKTRKLHVCKIDENHEIDENHVKMHKHHIGGIASTRYSLHW
jgi:hypothetical protein